MEKQILEKLGFSEEDIDFILGADEKYGSCVEPYVADYKTQLQSDVCTLDETRSRAILWQKVKKYTEQIGFLEDADISKYTLYLLFWLKLIPFLKERYCKCKIPPDIMWETAKDIFYKVNECKKIYGVCGVFTDWFFLMFELKLFALGRLHYEVTRYEFDDIALGDYKLRKGDVVFACHIPSSGSLTAESCMRSFKMAYDFFKSYLKDDILPVFLCSWLLYPPYVENVFKRDSNLKQFALMFYKFREGEQDPDFSDSWRIFGTIANNRENFPADTSLRKNMLKFLNNGGIPGRGYGILLYDGKNDRIINSI